MGFGLPTTLPMKPACFWTRSLAVPGIGAALCGGLRTAAALFAHSTGFRARGMVWVGLLGLISPAVAQSPVLIKEVVSREVSIHIGGIQTPEIKEIASREASLFILSGPADSYSQVISREVSLAVSGAEPPSKVTDFTVSPSPAGDRVEVNWSNYNPWAVRDLLRFDVYLGSQAFTNVTGMTPIRSVNAETLYVTLTNLPPWQDHFLAVVPVDALGNFESGVTYSATYVLSPQAISREVSIFVGAEPDPPYRQVVSREVSLVVTTPEAPAAVTQVARTVSPTGDRVTLDWSGYNEWLQHDVARYDVYLTDRPFLQVSGLTPVATLPAGRFSVTFEDLPTWQDHSFAVVPVDAAGNEFAAVASLGAYIMSPQSISREVSLFIGAEPDPPYREAVSREVSMVVASTNVPAPVTGLESGFVAVKSEAARRAIDLDWSAYNEWAQADVVRYRIYLGPTYFDSVEGRVPFATVADGTQRHRLVDLTGGDIYYVAVVAEDVLGQVHPVVRAISAQASDASLEEPPRVALEPVGQVALVGGTAAFAVISAGTAPLTYQWLRDGFEIPDATEASLTLGRVSLSDAGDYTVRVRNLFGAALSLPARLNVVQDPPRFTQAPAAVSAAVNGRAEFAVEIGGTGPFSVQWRLNGQNVLGNATATTSILTIEPVTLADAGSYTVVVSGPGGTLTSDPVALTITGLTGARAADALADGTALAGSAGTVTASSLGATREAGEPLHASKPGGASIWFRWTAPATGVVRWDTVGSGFDTLLAVYTGSTPAALIERASDEDHGGYFTSALQFNAVAGMSYAIAVDGLGGSQGSVVLSWDLTSGAPPMPRIVEAPKPVTASEGSRVALRVSALDATAYQWRRNGAALAGATSAELVLDPFSREAIGVYDLAVSGPGGLVLSEPVPVEIGIDAGVQSTDKLGELLGALEAAPALSSSTRSMAGTGSVRPPARAAAVGAAGGPPIWNVSAGTPVRHAADNSIATTEAGEPAACDGVSVGSLWFALEARQSGVLGVSASRDGFPVVLALYEWTAGGLGGSPLACSTNNWLRAESLVAGRTYVLGVDVTQESHRGIIGLEVSLGTFPAVEPLPVPPWTDVNPGAPLVFTAPLTPLGPAARHQWYRDEAPIPGATGPTYSISSVGSQDQGRYSVRIDNGYGELTFLMGRVALQVPPALPQEPEHRPRVEDGRFVFGLTGTPGQRLAVRHTADLADWETGLEFWMDPGGRATYEDDSAEAGGHRFYRLEEVVLHLVSDGVVRQGGQARDAWRVEGGRLGRAYAVETRTGETGEWTVLVTGEVREVPYRFELPMGRPVRVRAAIAASGR